MNKMQDIIKCIDHGRTDILRSLLGACETNGNIVEGLTRDDILNQPLLEEGTFLSYASKANQVDIVRTLLSYGADPTVKNTHGHTAVDVAASDLIHKIYVDELLRATAASEINRVIHLLEAGIDVNSWDSEGSRNTPLHWAACYGNKNIVACLIDRGADVNAENGCGATPLHEAVNRGDADICKLLMETGANPHIRAIHGTFAGKNCFELAKNKPQLNSLMQRLNSVSKDTENIHGICPIVQYSNNQKSLTINLSQLSIDSNKSTDLLFNSSTKEVINQNPMRINHNSNSNINNNQENILKWNLLWPEPKYIIDLSNNSLPFIASKDIFISILQGSESIHSILDVWEVSRHDLLDLGFDVKIGEVQPASGRCTGDNWIECIVNKKLFNVPEGYQLHISQNVVKVSAGSLAGLHYAICTFVQILRLCKIPLKLTSSSSAATSSVSSPPPPPPPPQQPLSVTPPLPSSSMSITSITTTTTTTGITTTSSSSSPLLSPVSPTPIGSSSGSEVVEIPSVLIKDEPHFSHRGILLDISPRGRTPNLEYLLYTINLWSSFKISHLHLYSRLTPSCDWQLCYSRSEMVTIDRYCRDRYIDLIPVLDVDSNVSQRHLNQMWPIFQEILAIFSSLSYVHVGPKLASLLVQPENLDLNISINETVETDMSEVFKSYFCLQELWHILNLNSTTTLLLCSNGLHSKPELKNVPNNVIFVEYGFQADYDFSEWTNSFKIAGANVLPNSGTASYNSLAGCPLSTLFNTKNALKMSLEQNSIGIIISHWSGSHHLTPHTFSWFGYLIAAGLTWNPSSKIDLGPIDPYENIDMNNNNKLQRYLTNILNVHVFHDTEYKIGNAILELGRIDTLVLTLSKNQDVNDLHQIPDNQGSTLYRLLTDPDNVNLEYLSTDLFAKMTKQIKRVTHALFEANVTCKFGSMELQELQLSADLMITACRIGRTLIGVGVNPNSNMGLAVINLGINNLPLTFRTDIANKMLAHIEQYKGTWLQRHLPHGLQASLLVLTSALHRFFPQ